MNADVTSVAPEGASSASSSTHFGHRPALVYFRFSEWRIVGGGTAAKGSVQEKIDLHLCAKPAGIRLEGIRHFDVCQVSDNDTVKSGEVVVLPVFLDAQADS